ncbi:MAG: putative holliday junction resolvase [Parcubacteria group bacterium LiPW_72]|nr:MAG: putative holliday junction resolvase [Parcubacteria group bacterium LiPW_72]
MPILAIDYGEKRVGLAISDPEDRIALKYKTILLEDAKQLLEELKKVCQEEEVKRVVIGLPISLSGQDSKQTKAVREFAEYVRIKLNLDVQLEDERLTSVEAERTQAKDIDEESARLILQTYLDRRKKFRR